jgi:hypothetical protein
LSPQSFPQNSCSQSSEAEVDPFALLNNTFRGLYSLNRDQVVAEVPLIGLTLIGTGEIFRFEYGQQVKCYRPIETLPKIKGLMHSVLGAHGTWRLLLRAKDPSAARQAATALHQALEDAILRLSEELPEGMANPARSVLVELRQLSEGWRSGRSATITDLPSALARVRPSLQEVIKLTGNAAYSSLVRSFEEFRKDSAPEHFRDCFMGVCGPGQGRRDNIEIAAAMAVMGKEAVGLRLLYLENALTILDGLKSLASIIVERDLGNAVFNDPYRMWRDILADAAIEHVGSSFFPELGPTTE